MAASSTSADLFVTPGALKVPAEQRVHSLTVWCDPAIWGLSLYDDQTPWFTLIECLQVMTHRARINEPLFATSGKGPNGLAHEALPYRIRLNTNLRHLLFRDKEVARIAGNDSGDDSISWLKWFETSKRDFPDFDGSYLRDAFDSFVQFAESLDLLRSAEVEQFHTKRWTSRHLQPVGSAMLFPDVQADAGRGFALDRRFFQRTGEILYLMLGRSARRDELAGLISRRLLKTDAAWDRIARKLQGPDADPAQDKSVESNSIGYLPIPHLPRYDMLAEDWIAVLSQDAIPVEDCLDFLMRLSGLHQVVYIVERAAEIAGRASLPGFVLDMAGSARNNPVQGLAADRYKAHKALPHLAVQALVDSYVASPEWSGLGDGDVDRERASKLLNQRFAWKAKRTNNPGSHPTPAEQLDAMLLKAKTRNHDIGSTFTSHARRIGLLSSRQRAGTWYAPTDALLEALVLANVRGAMELSEFLGVMHTRYHAVIGPAQAATASGELPIQLLALKENERRLEERLRVLGFIDRKSDDCAFVVNPFAARRDAPFKETAHASV